MNSVAFMLRVIAWIMLPFAVLLALGPLLELVHMVLFDVLELSDVQMVNPTPAERFPRIAREILINLSFLAVPCILWVIADVASRRQDGAEQVL